MANSVADAKKEAEACLKAIKQYTPTYPIYYDMEEKNQIDKLDKATRTAIITTFCEAIKTAGYTAGVYLNPTWLENYVDKTKIVGKYDIWLAHWTEDPNKPSKYDYGQKMWQWGVDKICGKEVDGDICYFDYGQPEIKPVDANSNVIYKSLGIAAIRKKADTSGELVGRCVKGGYYAASQMVTPAAGTQQWFRHAGTDLYSALTDTPMGGNAKLFEQYGAYTIGKTTDCVNVRAEAGTDKKIITALPKGTEVYLTGTTKTASGMSWAQVVYDGKLACMAKQWIST